MNRRSLATLLALVVMATAAPGFAQSAKQEANRLFTEGNVLYDKGDFAGALKKFEAARARYSSYKIDLNIATALVDLGRITEAAETYERFLARGSALAPDEILLSARAKLKNLKSRLSRLVVTCSEQGATLKVDGKEVGKTPRQLPVYLQPGEHKLEACKQGYACATETVTAAANEQRELTLTLQEAAATAAPPVGGGGPSDEGSSWKATTGWVLVGVGGASLVTGVIFGAMVSSKSDEHAEGIADGKTTYGELQEIADAGKRYETVQIATLVVGGVVLAAGGGLLLWHYLGGGKSESRSSAFVAPMLSTEVQGLMGGLRF